MLIVGCIVTLVINVLVNFCHIQIKVFKMGKRVMHYHKLKIRYNTLRGKVSFVSGTYHDGGLTMEKNENDYLLTLGDDMSMRSFSIGSDKNN